MPMFICEQCGHEFVEPEIVRWEEPHSETDPPSVEPWCEWACPECGSPEIEEAEECELCGTYWLPGSLNSGVCYCCIQEKLLTEENLMAFAKENEDCFVEFALDRYKKENAIGSASAESV